MTEKQSKFVKIAFGIAMKQFRLKSGLSQEKLAAKACIHRNYVGDVERGVKNICLLNMWRVTKVLDVPISKVMQEMERNL